MAQSARWIRLGLVEPLDLHASYAGLAAAQPRSAVPIVLWAQAKTHLCLGQSQGLAEIDPRTTLPVVRRPLGGGLVWVDEQQYVFVVIAPARFAPGRPSRWFPWALSPAVATYRDFGLRAYLNGADIWLHGRKIAGSGAATIGECAVVASSFLVKFPAGRFAAAVASPSTGFRRWLREGLALAMTEWAEHGEAPPERALEATFRTRVEAQHGWQFENAWPTAAEQVAIEEARRELAEPVEIGGSRMTRGGIKLNADAHLVECDGRRELRVGTRIKSAATG
jgi:lipoate-protein ligase A